jgi:hypothetical protein
MPDQRQSILNAVRDQSTQLKRSLTVDEVLALATPEMIMLRGVRCEV